MNHGFFDILLCHYLLAYYKHNLPVSSPSTYHPMSGIYFHQSNHLHHIVSEKVIIPFCAKLMRVWYEGKKLTLNNSQPNNTELFYFVAFFPCLWLLKAIVPFLQNVFFYLVVPILGPMTLQSVYRWLTGKVKNHHMYIDVQHFSW